MAQRTGLGFFAALDARGTTRVLAHCGGETRLWLAKLLQLRGLAVDVAFPTDFHSACYSGSVSAVKWFLETASREPRECPRSMVCDTEDFVEHIGDVRGFMGECGLNGLNWGLACACQMGNLDLARHLIKLGAIDFDSGLYAAGCDERLCAMTEMIDHGAAPAAGFDAACVCGRVKSARILMSYIRGSEGYWLEHLCNMCQEWNEPGCAEIARMLIRAGARPRRQSLAKVRRARLTEMLTAIEAK